MTVDHLLSNQGPAVPELVLLFARAILMASAPLVLTSCVAFNCGPTGPRRRTTMRRSSPTASFFLLRLPLHEREVGPALLLDPCTAVLPAPGVLKHVHTVEPSCSPPVHPVVQPCISVAVIGNLAEREGHVYTSHYKFPLFPGAGFPVVLVALSTRLNAPGSNPTITGSSRGTSHPEVIEQITCLVFIRRLTSRQPRRRNTSERAGPPRTRPHRRDERGALVPVLGALPRGTVRTDGRQGFP